MIAAAATTTTAPFAASSAATTAGGGAAAAADAASTHVRYVIVGAGISGLLQAVQLLDAGLVTDPERDLLLVEQGSDVGGTWWWNRFPGCACDVESMVRAKF